MGNIVVVVGKSGSGKSTSMRTLDPQKSVIINVLAKTLPWKGSKNMYSQEKKNLYETTSWENIAKLIQHVDKNRPEIDTIVVDDGGYIMNVELFERANEKGYDKFSIIAQHMYFILNTARSARADLNVVFFFHQDESIVDGMRIERKIKLPGRMIEERFNPVELCTVLAFTNVEFHKDKDEEYSFVVRKTPDYEIAKSPMGMFETHKIPNDLASMLETINNYYKADN